MNKAQREALLFSLLGDTGLQAFQSFSERTSGAKHGKVSIRLMKQRSRRNGAVFQIDPQTGSRVQITQLTGSTKA